VQKYLKQDVWKMLMKLTIGFELPLQVFFKSSFAKIRFWHICKNTGKNPNYNYIRLRKSCQVEYELKPNILQSFCTKIINH
jgi:hypothetical protein